MQREQRSLSKFRWIFLRFREISYRGKGANFRTKIRGFACFHGNGTSLTGKRPYFRKKSREFFAFLRFFLLEKFSRKNKKKGKKRRNSGRTGAIFLKFSLVFGGHFPGGNLYMISVVSLSIIDKKSERRYFLFHFLKY